jgi:hypothetical protein
MIIPATPKTPLIRFDTADSKLEVVGRSIPEDASQLYEPVFQLLQRLIKKPQSSIKVILQLEYFNTHSSRKLLDILRILESMNHAGHFVKVFWVCEEFDEETIDYGEDLKKLVKIPIDTTLLKEEMYDTFLNQAKYVVN